jgi:hypothetical protein
MKLKLLLFSLVMSWGILNAQDTVRYLVITEARMDRADFSYCEITNMGDSTLNLSDFEFGCVRPWTAAVSGFPFIPETGRWMMLPDHELAPGESFVIASIMDFTEEQWAKDYARFEYSMDYNRRITKKEMWTLADLQIHMAEANGDETDSVSDNYLTMDTWSGRECWYLRQHISPTDSVVIDQVGGVWTDPDGSNPDGGMIDVAGVTGATGNHILVRKFNVKVGNLDFYNAKGLDIDGSEWMPLQLLGGNWEPDRAVFWTVGNHGAYNLDPATFTSETVDFDWDYNIITVPWGVRRDDSIMSQFDKVPGYAWHYDYAESHEDSAFVSVRTGDLLTVFACGNELDVRKFTIQVLPPTTGANIVIPFRTQNSGNNYVSTYVRYEVSDMVPGMDTILVDMGDPTSIRVDTLFRYLEKAPKADWEIVWVDGTERTDLKMGDKLKVTAENGSVKEYYIKVQKYRKSRNALLSSITWPDIPEFYKGIYGWIGDTIPNFNSEVYSYKVQVPFDVEGIPAFVAKTADVNARVEVERARNLSGSTADKTAIFTSIAENDTTICYYKIILDKEKDPADIQPWNGEPFISEFVFQDCWANYFLEIVNPGNQILDLSNYMVMSSWTNDPAAAITGNAALTGAAWRDRFVKYIPGYKWAADSATWKVSGAIAIQDLNVSPLIYPGDVLVLANIASTGTPYGYWSSTTWPAELQTDVLFRHPSKTNTWNEFVNGTPMAGWYGGNMFLYKILNDSIKAGTKTATDPNDFLLIETFGTGDGTGWKVNSTSQLPQTASVVRKPQYYKGKPGFKESFNENPDLSEWLRYDRPYFDALGKGWPADILLITQDLGQHFMNEVTVFKSTVASTVYKVSSGYSMDEEIKGVVTGTTVAEFVANLIPADTAQTLTLKNGSTVLGDDDVLTDGDILVVVSADTKNTSQYVLDVTAEGLSHNAVLTSTEYTITHNATTGEVSGFAYGTLLEEVVENVTVPDFAAMNIIDANDKWVPLKMLNFDTMYVDVLASDQVYFEVIAEDGTTKIVYQLIPTASASDAFVLSSVFAVNQEMSLIDLIPQGTTVQGFLANLIPATGATMQLFDKFGNERTFGTIVKDDRLVVTSQDGETITVYYLQMLPAYEGEVADYLAYVTSSVYTVNQKVLSISSTSITEATLVTTFLGNLVPATGATTMVVDAAGNQHSGDINAGDQLKVTAANGVTTAYYSIEVNVESVEELSSDAINIFPNPSSGKITVSGLESGYRVRIYNILGAGILDMVAYQSDEFISLENQSAGVYYIVVTNEDTIVGRYKLILK